MLKAFEKNQSNSLLLFLKICLKKNFPLICFQQLFFIYLATQRAFEKTTDTPEVNFLRSSRTRRWVFKFSTSIEDRDRPVSRRSEPSSRTILIGEQPNPWKIFHLQDMMSRHRGAKQPCRYELSKAISLLSLA